MNEIEYQVPNVEETEKFYGRSLWLIKHREQIRKIGIASWVFLDSILVLFALWVMVDTFLISYETERGMLREMLIENRASSYQNTQSNVAQGLKIESSPTILASGNGKYDLVSFVTNSNSDWWAEFVYRMNINSNESTEQFSSFVYPNETRAVSVLAYETARISSANLEIVSTTWHRIDTHEISDFSLWFDERMRFEIADSKFTPTSGNEVGVTGRISFSISNQTAFGYWSVPLQVLLKRGNSVIGVSSTSVERLDAGETRNIDLSWLQPVPTVTEVVVVPVLNIFDSAGYMPPKSDSSGM